MLVPPTTALLVRDGLHRICHGLFVTVALCDACTSCGEIPGLLSSVPAAGLFCAVG